MAKKQYTTKFYEDNGGGIQAVTFDESGKITNVFGGFEDGTCTGLIVLEAARENWPDADPFEPYQWGGKSMEEVAEELEEAANPPYGEEHGAELIAETNVVPSFFTISQYIGAVDFYWGKMGTSAYELFKDMDIPEAIAYRIRDSKVWDPGDCRRLCELAGMEDEYSSADGDTVEDVIQNAADKLGVDIW